MENLGKTGQVVFGINEFSNPPESLTLPVDFKKPTLRNNVGYSLAFSISKEETEKLRALGRKEETTMFVLMMSLYTILLSKLCRRKNLFVGVSVENDSVLLLQNEVMEEDRFTDFLATTKVSTLSCFKNQTLLSPELISKKEQKPLVETLFTYQKLEDTPFQYSEQEEAFYDVNPVELKFDLALRIKESKENIFLNFDYPPQLFTKATIKRFAAYFKKIVSLIVAAPNTKIVDIDIVELKEKFLLLNKFNRTKATYPNEKTIIDLFQEQVNKTPDNTAIVFGENILNYRNLDESSSQLANYLLSNYSIDIEDLIGIQIDRGEWMIISLLAVLKTGAAYVPIDPIYPIGKVNYIKEKSQCKLTIDLDLLTRFWASQNDYEKQVSGKAVQSDNLAYVIYPMGSTGISEGVMIEHQSLVNLCIWHQTKYCVDEQSRGTLFSGIASSAFFWEVYPYLLSGATLYITENDVEGNVEKLHCFLEENTISHTCLPIPICQELAKNNYSLDHTRILTWGNRLDLPGGCNLKVFHNYGSIENTLVTTTYDLSGDSEGLIPIGKPISNTSVYIVSGNLRLQPLGVAGELCVAGVGLSRGYLNNEKLTNERFIDNPFRGEGRLFKTGDLARWLPDGNIEFLGKV